MKDKKISMLGATFKPDSDDLRDSPALSIALELTELGAKVHVHDPVAVNHLQAHEKSLISSENLSEVMANSELTILGTEWREYQDLNPAELSVSNRVIIDGRNVLNREAWGQAGWKLISLGKGN